MKNHKIKRNDIVKIVNTGFIYPSYLKMARRLDADIDGKWINHRGSNGINNKRGIVLNMDSDYHILIEIIEGEHFGEQYIIGIEGLKIVSNILDDELFEI